MVCTRTLLVAIMALTVMGLACSAGDPDAPLAEATPFKPNPGRPSEAPLPNAWVVEFTDAGFVPKRLEIEVGQQVRFVNSSESSLWPASNIHPTHQIMPEFDAGSPLGADGVWAFTFDKPGYWRYHNHMVPEHSGLIVATGGDAVETVPPVYPDIGDLEFKSPPDLTPKALTDLFTNDVLLRQYLRDYGPANTVKLIAEAGDVVGQLCHDRAHETGRAAYELFGAAAFALSSHECEAGAFHGATEAMFKERGTVNLEADVQAICSGSDVFFFRLQCIHGVGHGLMAWTSYELYDSLDLCDRLETDRDQRACYSGVFMENVVGGLSGTMGHFTDYLSDEDPHYPCNALTDRYVAPCYLFHSTRMLEMFEYDYDRVAEECAKAPETGRYDCFESFGRDLAPYSLGDPAKALKQCHDTVDDATHRVWCIQGSVQARFWETERADEAIEMCSLATNPQEREGCFWMIVSRARELYPDRTGLETFCARLETSYQAWCTR